MFALLTGTVKIVPGQSGKREQIEAQKAAFLTEKMGLTPSEAQQFFPVYNQYQQKREDLRKALNQSKKYRKKNVDQMSDAEIETAIGEEIDYKLQDVELQKEFHTKLKNILPPKKVLLYYQAEEDFKIWLLKTYGSKQGG